MDGLMQAGSLDRRITILRAGAASDDGFNTAPGALAPLATVWASREQVSDGERARASEREATVTMRFRIRWSTQVADVDERDAIDFAGRRYDVVAVKEIGRREGLELSASARAETP